MWRAVLTALESKYIKTARLIAIILAFALTAAVVQTPLTVSTDPH